MAELKDYILEHFIKGKDVVYIGKELVRCKDCEHFTGDYKNLGSRCVLLGMPTHSNDYCSRGERKEETK